MDDLTNGGELDGYTWEMDDAVIEGTVAQGGEVTVTSPMDGFDDLVKIANDDCSLTEHGDTWWVLWDQGDSVIEVPTDFYDDFGWDGDTIEEIHLGLYGVIDWDGEVVHAFVLEAEPAEPVDATNQGPTSVPSGAPIDGVLGLGLLVAAGALGGALALRRKN